MLDDVIDPYRCTPGELQAAAFATRRTAETLEWVVGRDTPTPFLQWRQSARVALWRAG